MKILFVLVLFSTLATSFAKDYITGNCTVEQEARVLGVWKKYYYEICHNEKIYRCGRGPNDPEETTFICLHPAKEVILGYCRADQEGDVMTRFKKYYVGVCHNGKQYRCGQGPNEPKEIRYFCLHHN